MKQIYGIGVSDKLVYDVLMKLKDNLQPMVFEGMENYFIVKAVVDSISKVAQEQQVEIYRKEKQFFLVLNGVELPINKILWDDWLWWCGAELWVPKIYLDSLDYRNRVFGRTWRVFTQEKEKIKKF
jgi:hypothetical protein